jgi:hypothetical protein
VTLQQTWEQNTKVVRVERAKNTLGAGWQFIAIQILHSILWAFKAVIPRLIASHWAQTKSTATVLHQTDRSCGCFIRLILILKWIEFFERVMFDSRSR